MRESRIYTALVTLSLCLRLQGEAFAPRNEPVFVSQHQLVQQQDASYSSKGEQDFISRSIFGEASIYDEASDGDMISTTSFADFHGLDAISAGRNGFSQAQPWQGIATFANLPPANCLAEDGEESYDIAIVGAPFDLGVTYRPGARFGPSGARMATRRLGGSMGYSVDHPRNPFTDWARVVDCGDIFNTPFDKLAAIKQLQQGAQAIMANPANNTQKADRPRLITIGGDHTISLPLIRALNRTWGPVAVLHFDSHLDSWDPAHAGPVTKYSEINHGSMFHILAREGAIVNGSNMHLGTRSMLFEENGDLENDARCGFSIIKASELDIIGIDRIIAKVKERVKDLPVYVSIDVDVMDPAFAPATGTLEVGGWTTREMLQILRGLAKAGIKLVGADIVEFSPIYDNSAETTGYAVGQIAYELLQWMVWVPVKRV